MGSAPFGEDLRGRVASCQWISPFRSETRRVSHLIWLPRLWHLGRVPWCQINLRSGHHHQSKSFQPYEYVIEEVLVYSFRNPYS
jgi:hypothetical protein